MTDETIRIITDDEGSDTPVPPTPRESGTKDAIGIGGYVASWGEEAQSSTESETKSGGLKVNELSAQKLEQELAKFMKTMDAIFTNANLQAEMKEMDLAEVELWVAITAEGSVSLLGQGAKVAGTRSVCMRFRRRK